MKERGRRSATEEPRDLDLTAGRSQQVDPSNHIVDLLTPVVDGNRELIGPVAVPIAKQHIAALLKGILTLQPEARILKLLDAWIDAQPPAVSVNNRKALVTAQSRIAQLRRLRS
jgi:transcription termination factor Rho